MSLKKINNWLFKITKPVNCLLPKVDISLSIKPKSYYVNNVFHEEHNKKVLISYLTYPFKNGLNPIHTNVLECYFAAEVFRSLNFCVDVADYDFIGEIAFHQYDVIYGFGDVMERSFEDHQFKGKRIMYSPGCNTTYSNMVSLNGVKPYLNNLGYYPINLARIAEKSWSLQKHLADAVIVLGNSFTVATYKNENPRNSYYQLNGFGVESSDIKEELSFKSGVKDNFVWIGSKGAIHKGLGILIEIFSKRTDLTLHILGYDSAREPELKEIFNKVLAESKNIINYGFVHVTDSKFSAIMNKCGAVIFPSLSEGSAPSVITATNFGLIPIIPESCGLTYNDIEICCEPTVNSVSDAIEKFRSISEADLNLKMKKIKELSHDQYSLNNYKINIDKIIRSILEC